MQDPSGCLVAALLQNALGKVYSRRLPRVPGDALRDIATVNARELVNVVAVINRRGSRLSYVGMALHPNSNDSREYQGTTSAIRGEKHSGVIYTVLLTRGSVYHVLRDW